MIRRYVDTSYRQTTFWCMLYLRLEVTLFWLVGVRLFVELTLCDDALFDVLPNA